MSDIQTRTAGEVAWREANWPTPEWGWDALPDDERAAWESATEVDA